MRSMLLETVQYSSIYVLFVTKEILFPPKIKKYSRKQSLKSAAIKLDKQN